MVGGLLASAHPGLEIEIVPLLTSGDKLVDKPLSEFGGKGLFTKEIEEALLDGRADIGVHSTKDMATVLPPGLTLAGFLPREDARDMLVVARPGLKSLLDLGKGVVVGSSSLRRSAQMLMKLPDAKIVPLRGNVETRLRKLEAGEFGATLLAVAGLKRLGISANGLILPLEECLPAPAQGAIGIECREDGAEVQKLLAPLNHAPTQQAVICERAFLRELDGSCRTPIAGYAEIKGELISFRGLIVKPDGSVHHAIEAQGTDALKLGTEAGRSLLDKAGKNFLA